MSEIKEQTEVVEEKKSGFLSRENLYSRINISLKALDRFILLLVAILVIVMAVGIIK